MILLDECRAGARASAGESNGDFPDGVLDDAAFQISS
jgi:hypothetical protein